MTHERGKYWVDHQYGQRPKAHWDVCDYRVPSWQLRFPLCSCGLYAEKCPDLLAAEKCRA